MFKTVKIGVLALACISAFSLNAQENKKNGEDGWKLKLGTSYRTFGGVEYDGFSLNNGNYFDGSYNAGAGTFTDAIQTVPTGAPGLSYLSLHRGGSWGDSSELKSAAGLLLSMSTQLSQNDSFAIDFDLTLGYHATDASDTMAGDYVTDVYTGSVAGNAFNGVPANPALAVALPASIVNSYDIDLNTTTLSAGVGARFQLGDFDFKVSGGPTLTIATYDFERATTVSYVGGVTADERYVDDYKGTDVFLGLYAAAEASYALTDELEVAAGFRYDWVSQQVDTDIADVELSGMSLELKLVYAF